MSESEEFIFNNEYCGRVKRFREETNMSAAEMADLIDVPADRYRKYETRSPMPAYLMAKFCRIVGCDLEHLLIGKPRERVKPIIVARKTGPADLETRAAALKEHISELDGETREKANRAVLKIAQMKRSRGKTGS